MPVGDCSWPGAPPAPPAGLADCVPFAPLPAGAGPAADSVRVPLAPVDLAPGAGALSLGAELLGEPLFEDDELSSDDFELEVFWLEDGEEGEGGLDGDEGFDGGIGIEGWVCGRLQPTSRSRAAVLAATSRCITTRFFRSKDSLFMEIFASLDATALGRYGSPGVSLTLC